MTWTEHVARWRDCTACRLCQQRDRIVLARGDVPCDVLFVGEAPGASEDALGLPFVGPAGRLLDSIVDSAIGPWGREAVAARLGLAADAPNCTLRDLAAERGDVLVLLAFTNLVACFPREAKARGENEPEPEEILACRPRLEEFVDLCRPRLVVLVGSLAGDWCEHDAWGRVHGAAVLDVVHPAAILRMPLAQKQGAARRCAVQIRNAVEDVLQSGITKGVERADVKEPGDLRGSYNRWEQARGSDGGG